MKKVKNTSSELSKSECKSFFSYVDLLWKVDACGMYTFVAGKTESILGYKAEDMIGKSMYDFMLPEETKRVAAFFDSIIEKKSVIEKFENKKISKTNKTVYLSTNGMPIYNDKGKFLEWHGVDKDISRFMEAQSNLYSLDHIIDDSLNEIYIFNQANLLFTYINKTVINNLGYTLKEMIEMKAYDIKPEFTAEVFKKMLIPLDEKKEEKLIFETLHRRKNGTTYPVEVHLQLTTYQNTEQYVAIILDRTKQKMIEKELHKQKEILIHQANYDMLTELPNRLLFQDRLKQAVTKAQRHNKKFALFFLDLDGFKQINDSFGHDTGDIVLKNVASRINNILRNEDTFSRLGGDEFTILIEDVNEDDDIIYLAQKVLTTLNKKMIINQNIFHISSSIGISFYPKDATNSEVLMKYADNAMYKAKEKGRNNFQFHSFDKTNNV